MKSLQASPSGGVLRLIESVKPFCTALLIVASSCGSVFGVVRRAFSTASASLSSLTSVHFRMIVLVGSRVILRVFHAFRDRRFELLAP